MDNSNSTIISITLGLLLSASEVLPYIKAIKGNGIFDVFYQMIKKQGDSVEEQQHLLSTNTPTNTPTPTSVPINTPTVINIDTSKIEEQLKELNKHPSIESSDKYEMMYIRNYIKDNYNERYLNISSLNLENKHLLESFNYNIDFDSKLGMYCIHW